VCSVCFVFQAFLSIGTTLSVDASEGCGATSRPVGAVLAPVIVQD
jgi:hypothetical protein